MAFSSFDRFLFVVILACVFSLGSCSPMHSSFQNDAGRTDAGNDSAVSTEENIQVPVAGFEFPDIPVPVELKRQEGRTSVVNTPKFQGGVMVYTGRVTVSSLIEFFKKNMAEHGWKLTGFLDAKRNFLAFSKGKTSHCLILLYDTKMGYQTEVQIWVSKIL